MTSTITHFIKLLIKYKREAGLILGLSLAWVLWAICYFQINEMMMQLVGADMLEQIIWVREWGWTALFCFELFWVFGASALIVATVVLLMYFCGD